MHSLYIVHGTIWQRVVAWFFLMFNAASIKDKVEFVSGVQFLYNKINPDQLEIPPFIMEYDVQVCCLETCYVTLFIKNNFLIVLLPVVFLKQTKKDLLKENTVVNLGNPIYGFRSKGLYATGTYPNIAPSFRFNLSFLLFVFSFCDTLFNYVINLSSSSNSKVLKPLFGPFFDSIVIDYCYCAFVSSVPQFSPFCTSKTIKSFHISTYSG